MITVTLPWPDKLLSPNARCHWSLKARATKKARKYAWGATLAVTGASPSLFGDNLFINTAGSRGCKECRKLHQAKHRGKVNA